MNGETLERSRLENAQAMPGATLNVLSEKLFPRDPAGRIGRRRVVLGVLFVLLTAVASLARQSGPGALDSVWAEDGLTYYQATFHQDMISALFTPSNGYLQLLPRIVIALVALFPVSWAAGLMAAAGALASSACALLVYHASAALVPSRAARLCFALPTAVLLYGESEVGNNVVNVQWYLIYAAFWMTLWNPRTRVRRSLAAAVLFAAIGSDPLALMFLPLMALRVWCRPLRESTWQLGGIAAGVLLQGTAVLSGSLASRPPVQGYTVLFALHGYMRYVTGMTLVSSRELQRISLPQPIFAKAIGILAVLAVVVAALLVNRAANRLLAAICAAFSLGFYCLTTMQGGAYNDRYTVPPILLLMTALAVLSSPAAKHFDDRRPSATRACVPLAALCILLGVNSVANYYGGSAARASQPSWSSQLARGRAECHISGTTDARLLTAPAGGWSVTVPCSRLLG